MISAGAGVMGSDNSNGSAHKHLAQFTLSNAPHGPTLSSCLPVDKANRSSTIYKTHWFFYFVSVWTCFLTCTYQLPNILFYFFIHTWTIKPAVPFNFLLFSPYLTKTPLIHALHFLPHSHIRLPFFSLSLSHTAFSFPSTSLSLYNNLYD